MGKDKHDLDHLDNAPCGFDDAKKTYTPPELIEWGSIVDVTRGPAAGGQDFPFTGGTEDV